MAPVVMMNQYISSCYINLKGRAHTSFCGNFFGIQRSYQILVPILNDWDQNLGLVQPSRSKMVAAIMNFLM